ncbi:MAG TPA: AAA family ATPase [Steroidobacteraceae bacterium]|nr:AAA family ATPase [Steroidobacteraceae bacterium]
MDPLHHDRFFLITGGPGSGKSTLIEALASAGYARTIEAGRAIIQQQIEIGGPALPHNDPLLFAELMLGWDLRSYHEAASHHRGTVFFDRGIPDVLGYLRLLRLSVPAHIESAAKRYRYNRRAFIAPPWREIYTHDTERKQTFDEAVRTYDALTHTYRSQGYELVLLPQVPLQERAQFVLDRIG